MITIELSTHKGITYADGLQLQEQLFARAIADKRAGIPVQQHILMCEHTPVITLGKHAQDSNVLCTEAYLAQHGIDLYHISRGGDATYHGPGQWTIYPILDLESLGIGVREYVERLEESIITLLHRRGIPSTRIAGASGVWLHTDTPLARKIAAIGIHCSRYITMHGMAFNVNTDPSAFRHINPCGFTDKGVTSLHIEMGEEQDMEALRDEWQEIFASLMGCEIRVH